MASPETLNRMFAPPAWFDAEEADFITSSFSFEGLSLFNTYSIAGSLHAFENSGFVTPEEDLKIFEFGSGIGEGLLTLDMFAKSRGQSNVRGSEISDRDFRTVTQVSEFLERVTAIESDGLTALDSEPESFDIILANMFGPCYDNNTRLAGHFLTIAHKALSTSGVILMNSDPETMRNVIEWGTENLPIGSLEVVAKEYIPDGLQYMPHIVVIK